MELLWTQREATARDIFEALRDAGQRLSYGAVKTVLDRLVAKQVVHRTMDNNQYIYTPVAEREAYMRSAVGEIVESLMSSFGEPARAMFLDHIKGDPDQLVELAKLIDQAEQRKKSA